MDARIRGAISQFTRRIRTDLRLVAMHPLCIQIAHIFSHPHWEDIAHESQLFSPYRQLAFVIGIALTTPEPDAPEPWDPERWERICQNLNSLYASYIQHFMEPVLRAPPDARGRVSHYELAEEAFGHYFNTGCLSTPEQVVERVRSTCVPFDEQLLDLCGFSATDAVTALEGILGQRQQRLDELASCQAELLARFDAAGVELPAGGRIGLPRADRLVGTGIESAYRAFERATRQIVIVTLEALSQVLDAPVADSFWRTFSAARGDVHGFDFITERSPFSASPLVELEAGVACCPIPNAMYDAVLNGLQASLLRSKHRARFTKRRDRWLEHRTAEILERFVGETGRVLTSMEHMPARKPEHDVIVLFGSTLLVVECKASPPVEPFRDADRSARRLKHGFSDVQKAFDQAHGLREMLKSGARVVLRSKDSKAEVSVSSEEFRHVAAMCVTADDYGPLCTDLSWLLEKPSGAEYPLAIDVWSLDSLLDALALRGMGVHDFCRYISERSTTQGIAKTYDELDVAGIFLWYRTLDSIVQEGPGPVIIPTDYSRAFDEIYYSRQQGQAFKFGKPPRLDIISSPSEHGEEGADPQLLPDMPAQVHRIGRNELCPCGSGRKYKFCCGRQPRR